jgi:hypothetical protein
LHILVFLMFLHLQDAETSNIPIWARCRNIKYTDMSKMQKHNKYRYEQDAETSNIPIYARDVSESCSYRYIWCFCILHISVYLMFLHLAYIGICYVSASCSFRYIWCFCILHISVFVMFLHLAETSKIPIYARCRNIKNTDICKMQKHQKYQYEHLMFNVNIKIQKSEIDILMFSVQIWFGLSTWTQFALCRYSLSIMNWWPVYRVQAK